MHQSTIFSMMSMLGAELRASIFYFADIISSKICISFSTCICQLKPKRVGSLHRTVLDLPSFMIRRPGLVATRARNRISLILRSFAFDAKLIS